MVIFRCVSILITLNSLVCVIREDSALVWDEGMC